MQSVRDCLAELGEFELSIPIRERSDDGIRLSLATFRRTAKRAIVLQIVRAVGDC
jgi:hypothetical protein